MQIRIIKPGMLSTVQDLGRRQYLSQAVPVSGAMDSLSARVANMAVGNDDHAAIIEFTYADAEFVAETDMLIAYSGDGAVLISDNQQLPSDRPVFVPSGTSVKLVNASGCRTYLAVPGGWDVPEVLGSRSTYLTAGFGGFDGRVLKQGDVLQSESRISELSDKILNSLKGDGLNYSKWSINRRSLVPANGKKIRVVPANEFVWFDSESLINFLSEAYRLGMNSNRMGYHLEGPKINKSKQQELLSTTVTPGTIQVAGNGGMILLMADCQTTGGYPRIAQVAAVDMPLCAQLKPGDTIYFEEISRYDAEMLYIEREQQLRQIKSTLNYKCL